MNLFKHIVTFLLMLEARAVLWRYKPKIIAVTGSVGKTTTKDAIFAALSPVKHIRKSQKSFNGDIGLPLTVLGCDSAGHNPFLWLKNLVQGLVLIAVRHAYPEWLVLEVGADKPGDIRTIAEWLKPDIVVMTGIPDVPVHVELFSSPEELFNEKKALLDYLKEDGHVILNGDDDRLRALKEKYGDRAHLYGFNMACTVVGWQDEIAYDDTQKPVGMTCTALSGDKSSQLVITGALGRPRLYGALAALTIADILGADFGETAEVLRTWEPPRGRMRVIPGKNNSTIIDDSYNSSPTAAISALETLAQVRTDKRKIAILADMLELGKYSTDAHHTVGEFAAGSVETLITVGFRARAIAEAALAAGMADARVRSYEHDEAARAGKELAGELQCGDIVLVKGSQSLRMERAVEELMNDPSQASHLLVRQDPEWKKK